MARLDLTLGALARPGFGVLVLDDYADMALRDRGLRGEAARDLVEFAVHPPGPSASLGGVLLSAGYTEQLRPPVAPPAGDGTALGVRLALGRGTGDVGRSLDAARAVGASFVEVRANRRPGEFPRGEAHVDAPAVAAAAALAQQAGLVPVVTVALPAMPGSAVGVTRAVTVNAVQAVFRAAAEVRCDPARLILRLPLSAPGPRAGHTIAATAVAQHTLEVLDEAVPAEVPAVWFLSAGHRVSAVSDQLAALAALAQAHGEQRALGFALGRALLEPALDGWITGGAARAHQRLAAACDAVHRALVPALARP